jgi:SAM-dependent methyltransferase
LASSWKKITNADSFTDALTALQLGGYGDYLKYRFFSASFIAGLALISAMRGFPGDILEIGCGTGQAAFVMKQLYTQRNIFLADGSFINLYLAKRFMASDGAFVCLDADDPLPFRDGAFKAIFSQDVLHYLSSKYLLLREAGRVCSDDGVIFLSHLHNHLGKDTVLGSALSAQGWMRLADSLPYGLFAEPQILEDFLAGDKMDLTQKISAGENHSANAFTLAISKRQDFFKVYENIGESFFRIQNHLTFNPFYKKHKKKNGILFKRQWPTAFYEMENSALDKLLPGCVELDKELIAEIAGGKVSADNQDKILSLMRQFIVYNSPRRY